MRITRAALLAATIFAASCASDGTTSPAETRQFETRLSASAAAPSTPISGELLTLSVSVTNTLPESVSGPVCADVVQARRAGVAWTDVTAGSFACSALAVIIPAGGTASITAVADAAKVRTLLGGTTGTVVFRVQHSLSGDTKRYTLQSNEVTWTAN